MSDIQTGIANAIELKARVARLEEALQLAVREMEIAKDYLRQDYRTEEPGCFDDSLTFCREALAGAGGPAELQEFTADFKAQLAAKDMRERAAKMMDFTPIDWTQKIGAIREQIAAAIRALPLEGKADD